MKKRKKLPSFKSEDEEAKFWDTHSPLDFSGEFQVVKVPVRLSPELKEKIAKRHQEFRRLQGMASKIAKKNRLVENPYLAGQKTMLLNSAVVFLGGENVPCTLRGWGS